jgi:uroporphyrinogen III methyltransferase/synthase
MRLRGITVLITRQREQALDLIRAIEDQGGCPVVLPMIRVVGPASWGGCDRALAMLERYEGAVFTSPNAVFWFFGRIAELKIEVTSLGRCAVYAVGSLTREALERHGITVAGVPSVATGEALAEMLQGLEITGKRFLVPRGELSRDDVRRTLGVSGALVDSPVVYRTLGPDPDDVQKLVEMTVSGSYGVVAFASPSAAKNFAKAIPARMIQNLGSRPKIVAIGETTGATLRGLGLPVDRVAPEAGTSGLLLAIEQAVS